MESTPLQQVAKPMSSACIRINAALNRRGIQITLHEDDWICIDTGHSLDRKSLAQALPSFHNVGYYDAVQAAENLADAIIDGSVTVVGA